MSTKADDIEIMRIADLARLTVVECELDQYGPPLWRIFELVAQMNAIDTTHVEATAHPLAIDQRLRPDQVTETNQRERLQRLAPQVQSGLYLVPQVIE